MPSKNVPAWMVANSGLGVEQLSTYYDSIGNRGMQNILMSAWAPHLLRLYNQTGREIFLDYARNGVIGRFANYPGYYVSGYTDAYLDPCYPCCGPDVTDIYYHHIPAQSAFALDFLMAEAEGEPVSRERFLDVVWGYGAFPTTRTVDNHIASLRAKVETNPDSPRWIKTVHGVGYRLEL